MFDYFKKPSFILALILLTFFIKEILLANFFPIFSGQDEARHYNTIQYLTEPKEKEWKIEKVNYEKSRIKGYFSTYNYSQEIRETAKIIEKHKVKSEPYDILDFNNGYEGKDENKINSRTWLSINDKYPLDIVGGEKFYHRLMSLIERTFNSQSILVRFFLIRIVGVILGTIVIYLFYLIAKNIGFSPKQSLLLTAIISFQPGLSIYYISINYDVLVIMVFALFTLGAILSLKDGLNKKNSFMMGTAVSLGLFTKAVTIVLLAVFILLVLYFAFLKSQKLNRKNVLFSLIFVSLAFLFFSNIYDINSILPIKKGLSLAQSLSLSEIKAYLRDSLSLGRIKLTSNSYWGNLGWENNFITKNLISIVWATNVIAFLGLVFLFFSKNELSYLPSKKYLIFFIFMLVVLQLGIRYADFTVYNNLGRLELGAPGRYFLPNLAPHLILLFSGLGALLGSEKYFNVLLKIGFIFMFTYFFYLVFDIIIPRFYL